MGRVNQYKVKACSPQLVAAGIGLAVLLTAVPMAATAEGSHPQTGFASPEQAVDGLVSAVHGDKMAELLKILGPDGKNLIDFGDPVADKLGREEFVAQYEKKSKIEMRNDTTAILLIGTDEWPLPIPIVKQGEAWRFDTKAGGDEILDRLIGRNELNAIQVSRAYVDAQRDYASEDRTGDGLFEYAQKFVSSPGKHDGLYWPANAGEPESPVGPLMANARAEGYGARGKHTPYHGYYYRILQRQGDDAAGGARDYVVEGHMIGGFALVAFPAKYGVSGIMTFIVNQEGIVYQKNLGPDTTSIAGAMKEFDPDASWKTP